jgi:hypothetical protein
MISRVVLVLFALLSLSALFSTPPSKSEEYIKTIKSRYSYDIGNYINIRQKSAGGGVFRTGGGFNYGK